MWPPTQSFAASTVRASITMCSLHWAPLQVVGAPSGPRFVLSGPGNPEDDQGDRQPEPEQHPDREQHGHMRPSANQPADAAVEQHSADHVAEQAPAECLRPWLVLA